MTAPLLKIEGLSKTFRTGGLLSAKLMRAVDHVDLEVFPGETLGLVGESGCGKSTLARCALRLVEPTSGSIHFAETDLRNLSRRELRARRRDFQIIFQDAVASLDPNMTVRELLQEPYAAQGLGTRTERNSWLRELLEAVALDESILARYPEALSGGQKQRIGIARALALKPKLIIADEPVSSLDASVQGQILNLLVDLQKRFGLTLLFIAHSLHTVRYLCTRVAVMYMGRIVEESPAETFFKHPGHPYSKMLLNSMPVFDPMRQTPRGVPAGEMPSPGSPPAGCAFHPRCPSKMPRCATERPNLQAGDNGSKIACFRGW